MQFKNYLYATLAFYSAFVQTTTANIDLKAMGISGTLIDPQFIISTVKELDNGWININGIQFHVDNQYQHPSGIVLYYLNRSVPGINPAPRSYYVPQSLISQGSKSFTISILQRWQKTGLYKGNEEKAMIMHSSEPILLRMAKLNDIYPIETINTYYSILDFTEIGYIVDGCGVFENNGQVYNNKFLVGVKVYYEQAEGFPVKNILVPLPIVLLGPQINSWINHKILHKVLKS